MSKKATILIALSTLVVGTILGALGATVFQAHSSNKLAVGSLTAEATTTVGTLNRLRAGKMNEATDLLETKLDEALIGLGAFLADPRELNRDPLRRKTLEMARDYRAKYPHDSGSPIVEESIARAFSLIKER